jgi:hypothetical protein
MTLCSCAFQLGDYFEWSDLWALIGAGIGAYLGFLAASQIYKRERKDKAKEDKQLEKHLFDTAKLLIENASIGGRKAETSFREFLKQYEEHPYGLHKRHINLNTPLITLDRMDRERILRSYKVILGEEQGVELWRETWRFCDGLTAMTKFGEAGVLGGQEDIMGTAERLGALCQELIVLGSYVAEEAQRTSDQNPAVPKLVAILDNTFKMGFVTVDVMNERLLVPIEDLFRRRLMTIVNARQFAEVFSKARSAYQRYGQQVEELKRNLTDYAEGCGKMAKDGEGLLERMNTELLNPH